MRRWTLVLGIIASFGLTGCDQLLDWMYGEEDDPPSAGCFDLWDPVCGRDGMTYSNACDARMVGMPIAYAGPCMDTGCGCDMDFDPVCDADGMFYPNPCEARCAGAYRVGPCRGHEPPPHGGSGGHGGSPGHHCMCPDVWMPVCTPDGQVFGNACDARCAGVTEFEHCDDDTWGR
jgi:coxsackievirus/adenovirus receptor